MTHLALSLSLIASTAENNNSYASSSATPTSSAAPVIRSTGLLSPSGNNTAPSSNLSTPRRPSYFIRKGSTAGGTGVTMQEIEDLDEIYAIDRKLSILGRFGAIVQPAQHRASGAKIALKLFPKAQTKQMDFVREYNYSFFLTAHQNIIDTYEGIYSSQKHFFIVQELPPYGNLRDAIEATSNGLDVGHVKKVFSQIAAALEFMHAEGLVHRDVQAKNVLLFNEDFSRVKLSDFSMTRKEDTMIKNNASNCGLNSYHAPEICDCLTNESFIIETSGDVWAMGILIYYALRRRFPWEKASFTCKSYREWEEWLKGKNTKVPAKFTQAFTEKMIKFFKNALCPKAKDRCSIKDFQKFTKGRWLREIKSSSDDDIPPERLSHLKTSLSEMMITNDPDSVTMPRKRRSSKIHDWLASTINTMTQISEQVVSASDF